MKSKYKAAYRALQSVARRQGITVDEVIDEINACICQAYLDAYVEGDTEALAYWHMIPCSGDLPDALELVDYLAGRVQQPEM